MTGHGLSRWIWGLALLGLGCPLSGWADACVQASRLAGGYGLNLSGRLVSGLPYAAIGRATFARGTFTLELTRSINGVNSRTSYSGTVSGSQCALSLVSSQPADGFALKGQIVGKGDTLVVTEQSSTGEAVVASGTLRRIGLKACGTANLKGTMTYITQGYEQPAGIGSSNVATGKTGRQRFDGKGCSYYRETIKSGRALTTDGPAYLPYSVARDCTVTMDAGDGITFFGVLVEGGNSMPYMKLGAGATRSGEYSRSVSGGPGLNRCQR